MYTAVFENESTSNTHTIRLNPEGGAFTTDNDNKEQIPEGYTSKTEDEGDNATTYYEGTYTVTDEKASIELPTADNFKRTGHTFAGWYKTATPPTEGTDDAPITAITTDITAVFARWTANTYTVTFSANGGEGTMDEQVFTYGDGDKPLTANAFERDGYKFTGWNTQADGSGTSYADEGTVAVDTLTATESATITLYAQWEEDNSGLFTPSIPEDTDTTKPLFVGHALTLSGRIVVNFYMYIPDGYAVDKVDFEVSGVKSSSNYDENNCIDGVGINGTGTEKYYMFECPVNSVQMADTITATFTPTQTNTNGGASYGTAPIDNTITATYSVKDYIDYFTKANIQDEALTELVAAIQDYGHYVQIPLAKYNEWTYGKTHVTLEAANADKYGDNFDKVDGTAGGKDIKTLIEKKAIVDGHGTVADGKTQNTDITKVEYSLTLDSDTKIELYLTKAATFTGTITAKVGNTDLTVSEPDSDGVVTVQTAGIPAHKLNETITITISTGTEATNFDVKVSPYSYIYSVLNDKVTGYTQTDNDLSKAVVALYHYCERTRDYVRNLDQATQTSYGFTEDDDDPNPYADDAADPGNNNNNDGE